MKYNNEYLQLLLTKMTLLEKQFKYIVFIIIPINGNHITINVVKSF